MTKLSPAKWCKNIVPRSNDGSCAPKESDNFGEMCVICEACVAAADWLQTKNDDFWNSARRWWREGWDFCVPRGM